MEKVCMWSLFSYLLEEEQSNVNLKTIPRQCLVYVTEFEPYFPRFPYVRPFSTYWSINCFHAWYYLEENSHFVSFLTSEELTSLGNWDWIQFEELKCLHTKELISFLASKLATFLENCKIYSTNIATKKPFPTRWDHLLNHAKTNQKLIHHPPRTLRLGAKNRYLHFTI